MQTKINVDALKRMRDDGEPHALIDVREKGEFVRRHIFGAAPIPRGLLELRLPTRVPVKTTPIVLYDDDGHRAALAAARLTELGYSDVRTLDGGLPAWIDRGYRSDYGTNVPGKDFGEKVAVQRRTPHLTPDQVVERQQKGERVLVLDSRTREEYERSHVPGAFSVPGGELPARVAALLTEPENRDATIVVNCAGRTRSILGADVLIRMGLSNAVYALENGTMAWSMAGHELERGAGKDVMYANSAATREAIKAFAERVIRDDGVKVISVAQFIELRESDQLFYALDVRLPNEFSGGHVPGSISLPAGQIALAADEIVVVNQAPVVMISNSGIRGAIAGGLARQIGYGNVSVLDGGIDAWKQAGQALVTVDAEPEVAGLAEARRKAAPISVDELHAALGSGAPPTIVDVKGSGDYALSHLPGSRWVPRGDLERRIKRAVPEKDTPVIVTCDSGHRATLAAATLHDLGYTSVRWLDGGLNAWTAAGHETIQGLDGAEVELREAKDDVDMLGRIGPLARNRQDMIDYLDWEIALGARYESEE